MIEVAKINVKQTKQKLSHQNEWAHWVRELRNKEISSGVCVHGHRIIILYNVS